MKSKQLLTFGIIVFISLLFTSCLRMGPSVKGNGKITEEVRQVKDFDRIKVSMGMNVYITQGSPAKVVVVADNNLHELIRTEVDGGVLKIYSKGNIRSAEEKKVMVTVEKLTEVKVTTGSIVYSTNQLKIEEMELSANTGSNITMDVNARSLKVECSTGSNIILSGGANEAELEGSIGANLKGKELKVEHCKMRASVGANVFATVTGRLEARASSGGNIVYYGEPALTDIESSSGGNVNGR
ncbi:MAG TPA: head GIN domain-containing protein [Prolixibacteraceae bacterium]|jgi:hypothetical protein